MICKASVMLISCIFYSTFSVAEDVCTDTALFFEENIPDAKQLVFEDKNTSLPQPGDFELVNNYLMSNVCGERWALVTVKNKSKGLRTINEDHLVALMASGDKRKGNFKRRIKGGEIESFTVNFGNSKVPIVMLLVNTH